MTPQLAASLLIWGLVGLHDRGESVGLQAVEDRVQDGSLFTWLDSEYSVRVGIEAASVLTVEFRDLLDSVDYGRKFNVCQNGLTLLLACCIELYQRGLPAP